MSDFSADIQLSRDDIVRMLSGEPEHLGYILSGVLSTVTADDVLDCWESDPDADMHLVHFNLIQITNHFQKESPDA